MNIIKIYNKATHTLAAICLVSSMVFADTNPILLPYAPIEPTYAVELESTTEPNITDIPEIAETDKLLRIYNHANRIDHIGNHIIAYTDCGILDKNGLYISRVPNVLSSKDTSEEEEKPYIDLPSDTIRYLASLIYLEAGAESYDCQKAVASVVINRMTYFNKSFDEIVYEKGQFSTARKVKSTEPDESCMDAAKEVVQNGPTIPKWVTFFREGHYFRWSSRYENYKCIDKTYFSYDTRIRKALEED